MMYRLAWSRQIVCLLAVLTHVPRLVPALTVPQDAGIYQPVTPPSPNSFSLLVNGGTDVNTTSALDVINVNTTSPTYDTLPALLASVIQCDGGHYGVNLDISSCRDALTKINVDEYIPKSTAQRGFGKRPNIILPNRWSSCKANLSATARCS